ncbi:MAG: Gfo/Idh/MocA family protein [Armatimonadota bacterium]|jgi:scyllo-inositol 2-dehydrogenase (NADP+)
MADTIRAAVIGYGPMHHFGRAHCAWIDHTPELELVGVCDIDPERAQVAQRDWPGIEIWTDTAELFARDEIDLVSVVTPHFTHAPIAIEALRAGKHVVVEKAMCLNVAEATAMIEAAEQAGRTLAVHHNRRHDGNFRRIRQLVDDGEIGEVFQVDLEAGGYGDPEHGWYTQKARGGGLLFFWGPHAVDWVLDLVGETMTGVTGFFFKRVWDHVDIADHAKAVIRFESGCVAEVTYSRINAAPRPLWRVLGTEGAIIDTGAGATTGYEQVIATPPQGSVKLVRVSDRGRRREEREVPNMANDWDSYWQDLADHLLRGAPVPVSGHDGRRTIAVFEAAERSSRSGVTEPVPYEDGS